MKNKTSLITSIPGRIENYYIFEELPADAMGKNFRAAEMENNRPLSHKLLTEVHPFLFKNPDEWTRARVLCERLRQVNNPNLYAPEHILKTEDHTLLVFPFRGGKTLAQIAEDASRLEKPIPFELAFAIALAIATMIEVGSSLVVKDQKPFHGFLTADHIIIDYQGNIFLKCFGLWSLFDENETAVAEMTRKYGSWLAPEFIRKEKLLPQSDFYYLGYILYRMLTGHYFSYLPGEDFESTFTSISFISDLPSTDIKFLTTLINFFKKTLNPAVNKRFANIREFKNHIIKFFPSPPRDFNHFKSNLAIYMRILYADVMEREERRLETELSQPPVEIQLPGEEGIEGNLAEIPLGEMEEVVRGVKTRSRFLLALLIVIIVGVAGGVYFLVDQLNRAKKEQQVSAQLLEQQNKEKKEFEVKLQQVQDKLKGLETQKTSTAEEQQIKDQTISQLKKQEKELLKEVDSRVKPSKDTPPPNPTTVKIDKKDSPKTGSPKTAITGSSPRTTTGGPTPTIAAGTSATTAAGSGKNEPKESASALPSGTIPSGAPVVPLTELTVKLNKLSGSEPHYPQEMIKAYIGRRATVNARLLIDENGGVPQVEISDEQKIPADVRAFIIDTLKKWKFSPPQKGDLKVKTWWPLKLKIHFKQEDI